MFQAIGTFAYRMRYAVIACVIAVMCGLGLFGMDLSKHLSQSGWYDPNSESVKGSQIADSTLGRDHRSDLLVLLTPPGGTTVGDKAYGEKVENMVNDLIKQYPDVVNRDKPGIIDPFDTGGASGTDEAALKIIRDRTFKTDCGAGQSGDQCALQNAFISIGITGDNDTQTLANYQKIQPFFDGAEQRYDLSGTKIELAGIQPVASAMSNGMAADVRRAEIIALPLVAIMLFFVFGGVVAAMLPVLIGGLTILGSLGLMKILTYFTEVNVFAQNVVTLIGLGIAIDYGLFIVSRFREELAEGYQTKDAVRRTVMTAGQTIFFSAIIILAALGCLLLFPQGFLKSVAYGAVFSVALAAIISVTALPAALAVLGPRIDALGFSFLRRTKTKKEVENGFWGKLSGWVMRHPLKTAIPTVLLLLVLIIPFGNIQFGGLSEKYLPPDNKYRVAQEHFDEYFPSERTEEVKLIISYDPNNSDAATSAQQIADDANKLPFFTKKFSLDTDSGAQVSEATDGGNAVLQMGAGLKSRDMQTDAIRDLRSIDTHGLTMYVAGAPALNQDTVDSLIDGLPLMTLVLVVVICLLMFLAFGSIVLPIKAALVSALGLGSTLGILTWIFIDGHGAGLANFTPGPLMSAVLILIIAIVFGLSTDYEVLLMSRMVEARQKGASTTEAVRIGTAHTGRIITAAAAILVVVTGAFAMSEIVLMKYIAFGMIAALILDATIIRMLLVPATMKLLGDDCWWAPKWMKAVQQRIGLGETVLDDELDPGAARRNPSVGERRAGTVIAEAPTSAFRSRRAEPATVGATGGDAASRATSSERGASLTRQRGRGVPAAESDRSTPTSRNAPTSDAPRGRQTGGTRTPSAGGSTTGHRSFRDIADRAATSRRNAREGRPDTGGWRLGTAGIRLDQSEQERRAPVQHLQGRPVSRPVPQQPPQQPEPRPSGANPRPAQQRPEPTPRPTQQRPEPTPRPRPTPPPAPPKDRGTPTPPPPRRPAPAQPDNPESEHRSPLRRRPDLGESHAKHQPLIASINPEDTSTAHPSDISSWPRADESRRATDDSSTGGGRRRAHTDDQSDQLSVRDILRRKNSDRDT